MQIRGQIRKSKPIKNWALLRHSVTINILSPAKLQLVFITMYNDITWDNMSVLDNISKYFSVKTKADPLWNIQRDKWRNLSVIGRLFDDFRRHPERRANKRLSLTGSASQLTSDTEVRQLHVTRLRQQNVRRWNQHQHFVLQKMTQENGKPTAIQEY